MKFEFDSKKINRIYGCALALVFVIALSFRLVGINWGMPYSNLHPDEGFVYEEAYHCTLNHSFEPRTYFRPNHVSIKLNTLLYIGIQELCFEPKGMSDFSYNFNEEFPLFMTASRALTALLGFGCVVLAYLIARFWDSKKALLAALLFAVFPAFIEHSHYLTPDIPLLFFLMGALWAALNYSKNPKITWLFFMSFFTALATCEKYPGLYGCVIIACVVIITRIKKPLLIVRDGFLSIIFLLLGILAVSPVLITDFRAVLEAIQGQNHTYHLGADGLNWGETILFYGKTTAVHVGLILTLCAVYGIIRSFKGHVKETVLLLVFLLYVVPISSLSVHWERYTLPIYTIHLLFGAFGALYLYDDVRTRVSDKSWPKVIAFLLIIALPIGSLSAGAFAISGRFLAPDSRIALQSTVEGIGVNADNTQFDCNTPLDPGGYYGAFRNFADCDPSQYIYNGQPTYVMTSSAQRDLYFTSNQEMYGGIAKFYHLLDDNYPMVAYYPVENPTFHFLEVVNLWSSARSVWRYLRGAMTGYEIRVYQLVN